MTSRAAVSHYWMARSLLGMRLGSVSVRGRRAPADDTWTCRAGPRGYGPDASPLRRHVRHGGGPLVDDMHFVEQGPL